MKTFISILLIGLCVSSFSQTTITIGTSGGTNTNTGYPAPYGNWFQGAKHQMVVLASELNAQGMTAGDINSLAFNVMTSNGTALSGFTIGIKNTTSTSVNSTFETGLTTVVGPSNYTDVAGWNTHTFSSPFYWDGTSNLLIETCFNNTNFTNNAVMYQTSTSFNSTSAYYADASGVCATTSPNNFYTTRPDMQFVWQPPTAPPVCDFSASTTTTCSGNIQFFDQSTNNPTSWSWNFGDGGTSTLENPSYTYAANGTYTVTLSVTNSFGNDSQTKTNYITVNTTGGTPITATCYPATIDGTLGFGITNVTFNTLNVNSGDASQGYSDFTCDQTTVFAGQTYTISFDHASPTTHNGAAWIDYNNDGVFSASEQIAASTSSLNTTAIVTIPSNAILNTPLRLRVIADYDLNAAPTPCADPGYGQAEDYTVIVTQDTSPPVSDFTSDVTLTCDGIVNFTDLSSNIPIAWGWNFGDGTTSVQQNPSHTYTTDGFYTVELVATNSFGSNTVIKNNLIEVRTLNNVLTPSCEPQTLSNCCQYGIYSVQFNTINNPTLNASEGYQDFSCQQQTDVSGGSSYTLIVRTGADNPQDTKAWIDYNNDGIFDDATELIMESLNAYDPQVSVSIPSSGITNNTWLRMRVSSDEVGNTLAGCTNLTRGQSEDYAIRVTPVGIEEYSNTYKLYPNPASNTVTIESDNQNIKSIQLYNLIGEQILSKSVVNNKITTLDISIFPNGTYFVLLENENGILTTKKISIQ